MRIWKILFISALFLPLTPAVYASAERSETSGKTAEPIFLFTPQGILPTTVPAGGSVQVTYTVTNNMSSTLPENGLRYVPKGKTPIGVTQNTSVSKQPPTCANPFTLRGGESCSLVLDIVANNLVNDAAIGGPEVCNTHDAPVRCSIPNPSNQLNITVSPVPLPSIAIAVGQDATTPGPTHSVPLLAQSTDSNNWNRIDLTSIAPLGYLAAGSCSGSFCIAAGFIPGIAPLLLQNINAGMWEKFDLSGIANSGVFNTASCSGMLCIAGGAQGTASLLLQSQNGGSSWNQVSVTGIPTKGNFLGASCHGAICTAVGINTTILGPASPLLTESTNGGAAWNVISVTGMPTHAVLASSSCNNTTCIAVGINNTNFSNPVPLLVQSQNGGSWQVIDVSSFTGGFNAASCSDTICIAAGSDNSGIPLLLQSVNGGTWTKILPANVSSSGSYAGASCSNNICIAVGSLDDGSPLLVQSINGGTWARVDLSGIPNPVASGALLGASCNAAYCIAGGHTDVSVGAPLLLQSSNGGVWANVTVTDIGTTQGQFLGVAVSSTSLFGDDR